MALLGLLFVGAYALAFVDKYFPGSIYGIRIEVEAVALRPIERAVVSFEDLDAYVRAPKRLSKREAAETGTDDDNFESRHARPLQRRIGKRRTGGPSKEGRSHERIPRHPDYLPGSDFWRRALRYQISSADMLGMGVRCDLLAAAQWLSAAIRETAQSGRACVIFATTDDVAGSRSSSCAGLGAAQARP